ncbi:hypothetical protein FZEAL_2971 [Fusarium zealandicum]|uniref:Uncharacterized protein n=1 Tax=Fusarium zealandicum TaxID=1053134 RepID=A0A8H4UPN0_9HYPO|nr:hypothetical protein FZEAL_2971 [Fusarium zealandicum]
MKTTTFALALLGLFPAIMAAETPAPSPTESTGCEPHGDHWHCEAARTTLDTVGAAATTDAEEHDHDHDHDHDDDHSHSAGPTESLAPSPTASVGCEPHGDHWHCEGPRIAADATATPGAEDHDHDHDHEDHSAGATESMAPSPTESVGCEPHGDHWHCEGPASTGTASGTDTTTSDTDATTSGTSTASEDSAQVTNAAGMHIVPAVGLFAAAVLAL